VYLSVRGHDAVACEELGHAFDAFYGCYACSFLCASLRTSRQCLYRYRLPKTEVPEYLLSSLSGSVVDTRLRTGVCPDLECAFLYGNGLGLGLGNWMLGLNLELELDRQRKVASGLEARQRT
jgi:hypothetical protein